MATIARHVITWTGFPGAPGFTTLYFDPSSVTPNPALRAFFLSLAAIVPTAVDWQVDPTGDTLDDATGIINGSWSEPPVAVAGAIDAGVYSAPSGAGVNLQTAAVVNGRRVKGRMYLVPLAGSAYQNDGSLLAGTITTINTAFATLLAAVTPALVVWHRPVGGAGGSSHVVTSGATVDKAYVLRSRRP